MLRKKNLLFFIIAFVYTIGAYAGQENETPQIFLFFGRFHPLLLHLPIGALLLTFFMEIVGRIRKYDNDLLIINALAFSGFFSVMTAILGYFLSLEGGYGKEVLQIHMYAGFGMAGLTCLLFIAKKKDKGAFKKAYIPLYITTLLLTMVTGHYGSILTHGDDFLTAYSPIESDENREIIVEIDSLYYYKHVISPIIKEKCIQCHNSNKIKGELNLSAVNHIKKGGENGEIIKVGLASESPMFTSLLLPMEEDEHMPPSGKPQLTRNEKWLIKHWIDTGADFKKQAVNYVHNDTLSNLLKEYLVLPRRNVEEADSKDLNRLKEYGFTIRKLVYGEPYLSATYSNSDKKISKKAMESLSNVADQLIELNLQESKLTDELSGNIEKLIFLRTLRLDQTLITDKTLEHLKNLSELLVLNLFNTDITENGLSGLLNYIQLNKVFFGNEEHQEKKSFTAVEGGSETKILQNIQDGFMEKLNLEKPIILGNQTSFVNDISIEVKGALKNEDIYYTLNGKDPDSTSTLYTKPIIITEPLVLKTRAYKKGWYLSNIAIREYSKVKYEFKNVSLKYPPRDSYTVANNLIDLEKGSNHYKDGNWVGFRDEMIATLDLGEEKDFNEISVNCLENVNGHVYFPLTIKVYAGNDLEAMKQIGNLKLPPSDRKINIKFKNFHINFEKVNARYIKVTTTLIKVNPKWHERAGQESYIYVDEIMVLN